MADHIISETLLRGDTWKYTGIFNFVENSMKITNVSKNSFKNATWGKTFSNISLNVDSKMYIFEKFLSEFEGQYKLFFDLLKLEDDVEYTPENYNFLIKFILLTIYRDKYFIEDLSKIQNKPINELILTPFNTDNSIGTKTWLNHFMKESHVLVLHRVIKNNYIINSESIINVDTSNYDLDLIIFLPTGRYDNNYDYFLHIVNRQNIPYNLELTESNFYVLNEIQDSTAYINMYFHKKFYGENYNFIICESLLNEFIQYKNLEGIEYDLEGKPRIKRFIDDKYMEFNLKDFYNFIMAK